jgi:hypothetical protein
MTGLALTAVLLATAPSTDPANVARAASANECSVPLDRGSREVYRFRSSREQLDFARLEVQAQRRNRNAHCVIVRTDRSVQARWTGNFYRLRDGRCRDDGQSGPSSFTARRTIRTGFRVGSGRCIRWTYEIQHDGLWYAASVTRGHR